MSNDTDVEICYRKALELLKQNTWSELFIASSSTPHYAALWTRDACITTLGAVLTGDENLIRTSKTTLNTISSLQAPGGQVPAVYWPQWSYWDWGEAGAVDAAAWFIIAAWHYYTITKDSHFLEDTYPSILKAFTWLQSLDANNFGLIDSPEAGDWMDSTLNRCGKVMYVNTLYYKAAHALSMLGHEINDRSVIIDLEQVRLKFNLLFWPSANNNFADMLSHVSYPVNMKTDFPHPCSVAAYQNASTGRRFYLSHVTYGTFADICDTLGNSLAVVFNLSDTNRSVSIMDYFKEMEISHPYPAKCLSEPITPQNNNWNMLKPHAEEFQESEWRNPPHCYHNAGIWPFVGAFYIIAALKCGLTALAGQELDRLAQANKLGIHEDWEFREWINSSTGKPAGAAYQTWNAATYIMAYQAAIKGVSQILNSNRG
jgi:glycogen debranching enzyme